MLLGLSNKCSRGVARSLAPRAAPGPLRPQSPPTLSNPSSQNPAYLGSLRRYEDIERSDQEVAAKVEQRPRTSALAQLPRSTTNDATHPATLEPSPSTNPKQASQPRSPYLRHSYSETKSNNLRYSFATELTMFKLRHLFLRRPQRAKPTWRAHASLPQKKGSSRLESIANSAALCLESHVTALRPSLVRRGRVAFESARSHAQ